MVSTVTWIITGTSRPGAGHGPPARDERGLALEQVLDGLDEEHVDAAGEQALDLGHVGVAQVGELDVAERRELGAGPDGSDDEPGPIGGGVLGRDLLGQAGRRSR